MNYRRRKLIPLVKKYEVLKLIKRNERNCDIVRETGIHETMVRNIRKDAVRIEKNYLAEVTETVIKSIRSHNEVTDEMERKLSDFITNQVQKNAEINISKLKTRAASLYDELRNEFGNLEKVPALTNSIEQFPNVNEVIILSDEEDTYAEEKDSGTVGKAAKTFLDEEDRNVYQKAASAKEKDSNAIKAANTFLPILKTLIAKEGYTLDQIFNIHETELYWEKSPLQTSLDTRSKVAKDTLTVMLGANASGDLKLKPAVVYHAANPQALKGFIRSTLGVYFRSSRNGCMTGQIFTDLVIEVFEDVLRNYCKKKNLDFKILIVLKIACSHPKNLTELSPNIKFLFLPPNTTLLIQPLNQGVITAFKMNYLICRFKMLIAATEEINAPSIRDLLKQFSIKNAIDLIVDAWDEVSKHCLHNAWQPLLSDFILDIKGFDAVKELSKLKAHCVALANQLGFEELKDDDLEEFLQSHEDLQEMESAQDDKEESFESTINELPTLELSKVLNSFEKRLKWLQANDYNAERSRRACRTIRSALEPYKQLVFKRNKIV